LKSYCGTPQYFSPEVLQRKFTVAGQGVYSLEADMWSIGIVLYVLLSGAYPFAEDNLFHQIQSADYSFTSNSIWQTVSAEAKDLISKLIVVDPKQRLTAQQALLHPWFTSTISSPTPVSSMTTPGSNELPMLPPTGKPGSKRNHRRIILFPTVAATATGSVVTKEEEETSPQRVESACRYRTRSSNSSTKAMVQVPETLQGEDMGSKTVSPTKRLKIDTLSTASSNAASSPHRRKGRKKS
jgi:serine/threonine protein kinase